MNNTELLLVKRAYVALLRDHGVTRALSQALLCQLRDAIAHELGVDAERVQNECEARAFADRNEGRQA